MATDWKITNITLQPDGKTTVADIALFENSVQVHQFSVSYTDSKQFQAEVLRKTEKYQTHVPAQQAKREEAERILDELKLKEQTR